MHKVSNTKFKIFEKKKKILKPQEKLQTRNDFHIQMAIDCCCSQKLNNSLPINAFYSNYFPMEPIAENEKREWKWVFGSISLID